MGPECDSCGMIDTIEHRLFYCKKSKEIWVALQSWMGTVLETNTEFTICEVIFGIPTNEDHYTQLINYIILISKWYINKNKEQGKPLFFIELLGVLKAKIDSITFLNTLKFRNNKDWQSLLSDLLN